MPHLPLRSETHRARALPRIAMLKRDCHALIDTGDGVFRDSGQGEVILLGPQIASGYLPATHPNNTNFGVLDGHSYYRTGDLGRLCKNQGLTIRGRLDSQIKLNGFRIELGEIEQCALQVNGVGLAMVVPQGDPVRALSLVLSGDAVNDRTIEEVRASLAAKLPPYMRPTRISVQSDLPLSLAGKVDRKQVEAFLEG